MSIRLRFVLTSGLLSVAAVLGIALFSYRISMQHATGEAKEKGALVFQLLEASRQHFKTQQKEKIDTLLGKVGYSADMPAELVSGFALTRGVWHAFAAGQEQGYLFKQATLDPLQPANKADQKDLAIIADFQRHPNKQSLEGAVIRAGQAYYYFAQKIEVSQGCLRCHGQPQQAPEWQRKLYGTTHGYNWQVGQIASADIVYVPMTKALVQARRATLLLAGLGGAIVLVLMAGLWLAVSRFIITPVRFLEQRATEISLGKNIHETVRLDSGDELGSLSKAVERLRISVVKLLELFSEKKNAGKKADDDQSV